VRHLRALRGRAWWVRGCGAAAGAGMGLTTLFRHVLLFFWSSWRAARASRTFIAVFWAVDLCMWGQMQSVRRY
jgi:hypothetical protein